MAAGRGRSLVILDFDQTIIDCDSDEWVVKEMDATEIFQELQSTLPWNSLMDIMMGELYSKGRTIQEIADCLRRVPLHPQIVAALKSARSLGCELRIVSDANIFFIETILKHHGLFDCFSEINTNPSSIDENGKLRIYPYQDFTSSPHGCSLCPPNMCKGLILERIRASTEKMERFIYIGDGRGDFCPSLKLEQGDFVMPRKNFALWDLICSSPLLLKAEVHEWSDANELESTLLRLTKKTSVEDNDINSNINNNNNCSSQLISTDCKLFQKIPFSSHEDLLKALPVPH